MMPIEAGLTRYHLETTDAFYFRHDRRRGVMLGPAYTHDTGRLRYGTPVAFVNWDILFSMVGR
jgi:hypothetical protein